MRYYEPVKILVDMEGQTTTRRLLVSLRGQSTTREGYLFPEEVQFGKTEIRDNLKNRGLSCQESDVFSKTKNNPSPLLTSLIYLLPFLQECLAKHTRRGTLRGGQRLLRLKFQIRHK